jgi:hypothetical protein
LPPSGSVVERLLLRKVLEKCLVTLSPFLRSVTGAPLVAGCHEIVRSFARSRAVSTIVTWLCRRGRRGRRGSLCGRRIGLGTLNPINTCWWRPSESICPNSLAARRVELRCTRRRRGVDVCPPRSSPPPSGIPCMENYPQEMYISSFGTRPMLCRLLPCSCTIRW